VIVAITDELREYARGCAGGMGGDALRHIADRIDREHRMALEKVAAEADALPMTDESMAEHGWIRLPLDADGVPIRPGDALVIFETGEHIRAYDIELYDDGRWCVCDDETMDSIHPDRLRHHHAPTVEDVLRELADEVYADSPNVLLDRDAIVERYAAKLRLAEGVDE
jgi:hypothetical protein